MVAAERRPSGCVRALLVALQCAKGEVDQNLARHLRILELARERNCDIAVFPEMSLTGSLHPVRQADRALTLDAPPVRALAKATATHRVAALFGVAERGSSGPHITQVLAAGGQLRGSYRKRHLGEDEEGFVRGDQPALFSLGDVPFGVAICAEGGVDYPFDEPAASGARLVCFCAAPGLYHRRVDEAGWRRGLDWWEGAGLADAQRHAHRLGIWIALATQAGSTGDEDFPGLAALVDPNGSVVARLPDWREGELMVDIPVDA